jgi:2-polyprenyl-3-methyl-5-hydroxy-6-metoxy-1,4-benzoquinol methylase
MSTDQQSEALRYFSTHADDWQNKARNLSQVKFNVIQTRNRYVFEVAKERSDTRSVLDVGCGTGDLVCDLARSGINALGVDFAQDMIELASHRAQEERLAKVRFECCSIFDFDFSKGPFDLISANGFIEYISQTELDVFLSIVSGALTPGGSFVVGSRNRLFNLHSMNEFTRMELNGTDMEELMNEAIALSSGTTLEAFSEMKAAPLQKPDTKHTKTNINVTTRFQYTPLQVVKMLAEKGLKVVEIYPVHIHGVHPSFKEVHPEVHTSISNLLQAYARHCLELVPSSSTFMVHAQKGDF